MKRYSSGMYVRLAFAVAAHLEPEILLVDEVLAVGDAQFQKKCLGKMDHIAKGGRTVLFVSHQMSAVQRLCRQCLFLEKGRLKSFGAKDEIIAQYLSEGGKRNQPGHWIDLAGAARRGSQEARFMGMRFRCPDPEDDGSSLSRRPIRDRTVHRVRSTAARQQCRGYLLRSLRDKTRQRRYRGLGETIWLDRETTVLLQVKELHLNPGTYILGLYLSSGESTYDQINEVGKIEIVDPPSVRLWEAPSLRWSSDL